MRYLIKDALILFCVITMTVITAPAFSQEEVEWDESITDTEFLAGQSKKELMKEAYHTNGDIKTGNFTESPNIYATFTLYKGNSYAFVIGAANNLNKIRASFYANNFVDNISNGEVEKSNYAIFRITPINSGTYYLKIESYDESSPQTEWLYYYGFKQNK